MNIIARLKVLCLISICVLNVDAQTSMNQQKKMPEDWSPYFRYNEAITDSIAFKATVAKFDQFAFQDDETGLTLEYNLFVPDDYDSSKKYPLLLFMHDASVTGRETTATLTQGLGAVIWASDYEQEKHPCIVLAPQYATVIADNRSEMTPALEMGGMP